jgi:hypothetical protein
LKGVIAKGAKRMKHMSLICAASLTLALLITAYSQSGAVKKVQVTTQTLASQPAGKPFVIDLAKGGTVYEIDANVNTSQVNVRTASGEQSLSKYGKAGITGNFLLGKANDLSTLNFGFPSGGSYTPPDGGGMQAQCSPQVGVCKCVGPADCKNLNATGVCANSGWVCGKMSGKWGCFCVMNK